MGPAIFSSILIESLVVFIAEFAVYIAWRHLAAQLKESFKEHKD